MFTITLNNEQVKLAILVGKYRYLFARSKEFNEDKYGKPNLNPIEKDIQGAAGELVYSIYSNRIWDYLNYYKGKPDFEANKIYPIAVEVRQTTAEYGSLIIRPHDNPDRLFYLIIGSIPNFRIVGHIKGEDGMKDKYKKNPNDRKPAWFVPQRELIQE
jgi:hypothetical protein